MGDASSDSLEITRLLHRWSSGDAAAADALFPLVYGELRRMAKQRLARERSDHTLQGTALVHEAFLRLSGQSSASWRNRNQFLALASQMMRRVLVDHARQRAAAKRGSAEQALSLDDTRAAFEIDAAFAAAAQEEIHSDQPPGIDVLGIDRALEALAVIDPQQARIVELRYFGGLTIEETADVVEISPATVKREWAMARAWLRRELSAAGANDPVNHR